ncbi:MAG: endonuclease/exonuclease/phosphatase family protein, partial [Patescibacteria group bacterium]
MKAFFWLFALAAVLPLLAPIFWFFELFSHYAVYYAWVSGILLLLSLLKKWPAVTLIMALIFAMNISQIAPYYQETPAAEGQVHLKIVSQNFFLYNEDFDSFHEVIRQEGPDLFAIQEAGPLWEKEIEAYRDDYPYIGFTKSLGVYGTVIASKYPAVFEENDIAGYPTLIAHVTKNDESFSFFSVHPPAPVH